MIVLICLNMFDFYYYSPRYPKVEGKLKIKEDSWVTSEEERVIKELQKSYSDQPVADEYRILFLGSSQTRGIGATKHEDVFVYQLEQKLNQNSRQQTFRCFNGAIPGSNARVQYELYMKEFIQLRPNMVAINLSNNDNDFDEREFVDYLEKIIRFNKEKDIKTVFILEPNSIEHRYFVPLHDVMKEIAFRNDIVIFDLHNFLRERYDSGFIWWDSVHMSSYGHKLSAEFLYEKLLGLTK